MELNATVQFRTSASIKEGAFAVFEDMGISPSVALQLFLRHVQKTKTIPFILTANQATLESDLGYDDWLRARLNRTMQLVDSGQMPTLTSNEVRASLKARRAQWRTESDSGSAR